MKSLMHSIAFGIALLIPSASGNLVGYTLAHRSTNATPSDAPAPTGVVTIFGQLGLPPVPTFPRGDTKSPVPTWGQCGGTGYTGSTVCADYPDVICYFYNIYESYCDPLWYLSSAGLPIPSSTSAPASSSTSSPISSTTIPAVPSGPPPPPVPSNPPPPAPSNPPPPVPKATLA
ncbi:hypothetical protein D9619_007833 [Psilocybe cf. subviscida]|uniref:CBM1 domain-containing protein n=1 Tax=Psilocybe cf. subviscida TaxID=2480587 RepID=A0A8H5ATZ4_9AGAR|nr:hypothetical protein D9619_007833 [Psilocybe cf. subviscida]